MQIRALGLAPFQPTIEAMQAFTAARQPDTPDEPAAPVRLRARLRLQAGADIHLGPGRVDLLEGIAQTGSIAEAGRRLGMSYQRA